MTTDTAQGFATPFSLNNEYNANMFLIMGVISGVNTCLPVKVVSCTNSGGVSPVGFVDVVPLIMQFDGMDKLVEQATIYNLPYTRLQGGKNAVIIDPEVGDIGIAIFCSRDISVTKETKQRSVPPTRRMHSFSDGIYIGGILNAAPEQYVQYNSDGIVIHSPNKVQLEAPIVNIDCEQLIISASAQAEITTPTFTINANVQQNGTFVSTGLGSGGGSQPAQFGNGLSVTGSMTNNGVNVGSTHVHPKGGGGANTGTPL